MSLSNLSIHCATQMLKIQQNEEESKEVRQLKNMLRMDISHYW